MKNEVLINQLRSAAVLAFTKNEELLIKAVADFFDSQSVSGRINMGGAIRAHLDAAIAQRREAEQKVRMERRPLGKNQIKVK